MLVWFSFLNTTIPLTSFSLLLLLGKDSFPQGTAQQVTFHDFLSCFEPAGFFPHLFDSVNPFRKAKRTNCFTSNNYKTDGLQENWTTFGVQPRGAALPTPCPSPIDLPFSLYRYQLLTTQGTGPGNESGKKLNLQSRKRGRTAFCQIASPRQLIKALNGTSTSEKAWQFDWVQRLSTF